MNRITINHGLIGHLLAGAFALLVDLFYLQLLRLESTGAFMFAS